MKYHILIVLLASLACMPVIGGEVVHSTDAETVINQKDYPVKKRMGVRCPGGKVAKGWGVYRGAGKAVWGVTGKEAHSGKHSVFLTFKDWLVRKKDKRELASFAILVGESNGYTGEHAIPAKPNTQYSFSFWLKGNVSFVALSAMGWNSKGKRVVIPVHQARRNGLGIRTHRGVLINPNPFKWENFTGEFTTPKDITTMVLRIVVNNPVLFQPEQTIYLDDAVIKMNKEPVK
jgi:hypothetical protein